MNQKPEMPGEDNRMKKHPAKRPSELEPDRKLKPEAKDKDMGDHEASPGNVGRHPAPRLPSHRDDRRRDDRHAA